MDQTSKAAQMEVVKVIGTRMREARELCGLSLSTAAERLGYQNPSKLSKIELASDTLSVPVLAIRRAAELYEVSADFIFGLTTDWEIGARATQERAVSRWLFAAWEEARARDLAELIRLHTRLDFLNAAIEQLAQSADSAKQALERFAALNSEFEDMRGGAKVVSTVDLTEQQARSAYDHLRKFRKTLAGTPAHHFVKDIS